MKDVTAVTGVTESHATRASRGTEAHVRRPYADRVIDALGVDSWLTLPDAADRLGTDPGQVRRLVQDRQLVAIRGTDGVRRIPERFLVELEGTWRPVPTLPGTLVLLADAGYSDEEAVHWLFTADPTLAPVGWPDGAAPAPIDLLAAGQKTEVRRRAQALGF